MRKHDDIVIIGAGNVATHLAKALFNVGYSISQIWGRNLASAELLSREVKAEAIHDLAAIQLNAHLYVFAVKDDVLASLLPLLPKLNGAAVHTSGTLSTETFSPYFQTYGILYPLQTFSKNKIIDISKVPFVVNTSSEILQTALLNIVRKLGSHAHLLDDQQRIQLHIGAVFANNFSNHLWKLAFDYLKNHGISPAILHPLMTESLEKAIAIGPENAQTGPAFRGDIKLIDQHLLFLSEEKNDHLASIYKLLSESILKD